MIRSRHSIRAAAMLLLGALCLLLSAAVVQQFMELQAPPNLEGRLGLSQGPVIPALKSLPTNAENPALLAAVMERPLFTPSRRKPEPIVQPQASVTQPAAAVVPSPPQAPSFALVGIVHGGGESVALIRPLDGQPIRTLHQGDSFQGWNLVAIGIDRASFRNGAVDREMILDFRGGPAP